MDLTAYINVFVLIPLLGFIISVLVPAKNENLISKIAFYSTGLSFFSFLVFFIFWIMQGMPVLNLKEISLYHNQEYEFLVDFIFDKITATYLFVGSLLTFTITVYSRYYLHRESGYKRFFNTILFFYLGYTITIFAGNFETLFIGWEILGISSFLLIGFYRDRYLPMKNAVKVFAIYRIGDVGILLAMWASHHLWHENITFIKLNNYDIEHHHLMEHSTVGVFISLMLLLAAAAKSALFPFSSWLPRAMEGPTPSSAIFYGSLSVHFGIFLLLRTYPFWEHQYIVHAIIIVLGVITFIIAYPTSRVQSTIKSKVAYISIAHIGLMFIEIGLGWTTIALVHFVLNAFVRTYQLLTSPSQVSFLIKEQFYHYHKRTLTVEDSFPKRLEYSFFILSLREWNLDRLINTIVFNPLKKIGSKLNFITTRNVFLIVLPLYAIAFFVLLLNKEIDADLHEVLPEVFSLIGLLLVLKAFAERKHPRLSWLMIIFNHFWIALAISFNEQFDVFDTVLYLSGVVVSGIIGFVCLQLLRKKEKNFFDLNRYYGHVHEYPKLAMVFLLAALGLMGFPITSTFIGEDLLFSHVQEHQIVLATTNSISFIVGGIALIRIYARLFTGPHCKTNHETPYQSS